MDIQWELCTLCMGKEIMLSLHDRTDDLKCEILTQETEEPENTIKSISTFVRSKRSRTAIDTIFRNVINNQTDQPGNPFHCS